MNPDYIRYKLTTAQTRANDPHEHYDVIRFPDGKQVRALELDGDARRTASREWRVAWTAEAERLRVELEAAEKEERDFRDAIAALPPHLVEAIARTLSELDGHNPDTPYYYETLTSGHVWHDPIPDYLLGTKRADGTIIEQWPTMPQWQFRNKGKAEIIALAVLKALQKDNP